MAGNNIDMRIGLQTIHYNFTNIGCALQACSMLDYLKTVFDTVEIIDHRYPGKMEDMGPVKHTSHLEMLRFIDRLPRSATFMSEAVEETQAYIREHYDMVIYGSDEIWKWHFLPGWKQARVSNITAIPNIYWPLELGVPHISYAACIGSSGGSIPPQLDERLSASLRQFDAISVRDVRTAKFVEDRCSTDVQIVPDPVFLHDYTDQCDLDRVKYKLEKAGANLNKEVIGVYAHSNKPLKLNQQAYQSIVNLKKCELDPIEFWAVPKILDGVISNTHHGVLVALLHNTPCRVLDARPAKVHDHVKKFRIPEGSFRHVRDNWDSDHVAQTVIQEREIGLRWLEQHLPGEQARKKTAS